MKKRIDLNHLYPRYLSWVNVQIQKLGAPAEDVVHLLLHGEMPLQVPGLRRRGPNLLKRGDPAEALLRALFFETAAKDLQALVEELAPGQSKETVKNLKAYGKHLLTNLARGRLEGARSNKSRAENNQLVWCDMASTFKSKQPHLTLEELADKIQQSQSGKKRNGEPYSRRTIIDRIQGQKPN